MITTNNTLERLLAFLNKSFGSGAIDVAIDSTTSSITVEQLDGDNLNVTSSLQVNGADVDNTNPIPIEITPVNKTSEVLVVDEDLTASWADVGAEINCNSNKTVTFFIDFTVNDSLTNEIRVLCKDESGGANEYVLENITDYTKVLGDSSIKIAYPFDVTGIPYIQLQAKTGTVGVTAGTLSINIVKEY